MEDVCIRRFGWFKDATTHVFNPRYDLVAPKWLNSSTKMSYNGDVSTLYEKRYVCDVCKHCGKRVERLK